MANNFSTPEQLVWPLEFIMFKYYELFPGEGQADIASVELPAQKQTDYQWRVWKTSQSVVCSYYNFDPMSSQLKAHTWFDFKLKVKITKFK